jgi:fibronectin type 3 domain-containing protein
MNRRTLTSRRADRASRKNQTTPSVCQTLERRVLLSSAINPLHLPGFTWLGTDQAATVASVGSVRVDPPTVGSTPPLVSTTPSQNSVNGLQGQYFTGTALAGAPALTRIDPTIAFNWLTVAPAAGIASSSFSARWTGQITIPRSGKFTFYASWIGGVRVILGNTVLVNHPKITKLASSASKSVTLVGGQTYAIEIDYFSAPAKSRMLLQWAGPGFKRQTISTAALLSGISTPQAPGGLVAQTGSATTINLAWQPDAADTSYKLQRSDDGVSFTTIATLDDAVTAYTDSALPSATAFTYRIVGSNAAGDSAPSGAVVASTAALGPNDPTSFAASVTGSLHVSLHWADSAGDQQGFILRRSQDGGAFADVATLGASATAYTDAAAPSGHEYTYQLVAFNASGNSSPVAAPVALPPAAPSNLNLSVDSGSSITLTWSDPAADATGFIVYRSDNGGPFALIHSLGAPGAAGNLPLITYSDTAVTSGNAYVYAVYATADAMTSAAAFTQGAIPPTAPTGLSATPVAGPGALLHWTDNSSNETGFLIDRSTDGGSTWNLVTTVGANVTVFADATALGMANYVYRVRAASAHALSTGSQANVSIPLAAPVGVSAHAWSASVIEVDWTDDNAAETGYLIERSPNGSSGWSTVATTAANANSYLDTSVSASVSYFYRITTETAGSPSAPSAVAGTIINYNPLFSPQWKADWQQAIANNYPWANTLLHAATASGTSSQVYSDMGDYGAIASLITGNATYADDAWAALTNKLGPTSDPNVLRDIVSEYSMVYYALKVGGYWNLHPDRQQTMISGVNVYCDNVFTQTDVSVRFNDSDQVVGSEGIMLWALVSQDANPKAADYLSNPLLGGLTPTSDQPTTVRNAIANFCLHAAGGQWIESNDYNLNTLKLLICTTEGIRAVTGHDYFPEATALYKQIAISEMAMITPDLNQPVEWGDEEWPRSMKLFDRETLLGMLAGVTQVDPTVGPYVQQFVIDLANKYGWTGDLSTAQPWGRLFYFFDPYAATADWRTLPQFAAPQGGVAASDSSGIGMTFLREGTAANSPFGELLSYNNPGVDHSLPYVTDFQLYDKGEWTVTHPEIYAPTSAMIANTFLVGGLGTMTEAAGRIGYDAPADGSYAYSAASTGGNYGWNGYYNPPTTFVQEATRSMFYLPGGASGVPILVLYDRMNVDQPTSNGYYPNVWQTISNSPLKQLVFHMPVVPTVTPDSIAWQTAGGQDVKINLLTPGLGTQITPESTAMLGGNAYDSELHYLASVTPTSYQKWNTFVSVVQTGDGATESRIVSTDGSAEGVDVQRPGANDAIVMFNATQGADLPRQVVGGALVSNPNLLNVLNQGRFHEVGFNVNVHTTTSTGDVYIADLDPAKHWTLLVDGAAQAATFTSAGIGHVQVAGAGDHTVSVVVG